MKILFITNGYAPAGKFGSGKSSKLICEYLKDNGHDVDIFVHDRNDREPDYEKHGLGDMFKGQNLHPFKQDPDYRKIEDGEYDILHQYGGNYKGMIGKKFKRFDKTKMVTSLNGPSPPYICYGDLYDPESRYCCRFPKDFYCSLKSDHWGSRDYKYNPIKASRDYGKYKLNKHFLKVYDRLFPQSKWLKRLFIKAGVSKEKLRVIPNFYDPEFYDRVENADVEESGVVNLLYVGRLEEGKGVLDLVKAFNRLESSEDTRLIVAGTGEEKEKISRYVKEKGLSDYVDLKGFVPYEKIHRLYLKADIFVHPCRFTIEAFNRTIVEAGLTKNAMLVSDVGTTPEIVGEDGLIFKGGDVEDFVGKLERLIENENLRETLQDEMYEKVRRKYSRENVMKMVEEEYSDLVR